MHFQRTAVIRKFFPVHDQVEAQFPAVADLEFVIQVHCKPIIVSVINQTLIGVVTKPMESVLSLLPSTDRLVAVKAALRVTASIQSVFPVYALNPARRRC